MPSGESLQRALYGIQVGAGGLGHGALKSHGDFPQENHREMVVSWDVKMVVLMGFDGF